MPILTETQPGDYAAALEAAIGSWWYALTFLFPGLVYLAPAAMRWRHILWLIPLAFLASCVGYLVYWLSIDWALMDYYRRTGYLPAGDTWYVFMPFFRGLPNALVATTACTLVGWVVSLRRGRSLHVRSDSPSENEFPPLRKTSANPYEPPSVASHTNG
ncbi:hypothetical protein Pla22_42470 [Rubripirellula amarantea]|uniref:Uncharacterized protein n=1 Tax=Rubripirellula amarantea TaxID=2527999 RepID=A0A5C5WN09_9BACT|nr:hypothetical protein [Rubripirellula amarantea]TWT51469.1 hypothetical protein Pla22_42470 [Rubripirellula amarantea]